MLDLTIPKISVSLFKKETKTYPRYSLPDGYYFTFYKKGDEVDWARIHVEVAQFETVSQGIETFNHEFITNQRLKPDERVIFIRDPSGEIIATSALWDGEYLGELSQRIHWVCVTDKCTGLGIAKAMLTKLMDMYNELGYSDFIHLWTGTRNYAAIAIYKSFGFEYYRGGINPRSNSLTDNFFEQNEEALAFIEGKIAEYHK
jgi:GNAT superfamily N-acetyltransferase